MSKESETFLHQAAKRNRLIRQLVVKDRVYQPRREFRTSVLRVLSKYLLPADSELRGEQCVEEAIKIAESGNPLIIVSNHLSDADHALRRFLLERHGYREFADRLVYIAGLKMIERPEIRQISSAESMILTPTPFDIENLGRALRVRNLNSSQRKILDELVRRYRLLGWRVKKEATTVLKKGEYLSVYPESTRSRNGQLNKSHRSTAAWYREYPNAFVLPIAVQGGENLLPVGAKIPRRTKGIVTVSKPVPVEKVLHIAQVIPKNSRLQIMADYPMAFVAGVLPDSLVRPSLKAYFADLRALGTK